MSTHLHRAFTLIELMVVILMIAVMAGVVVPAYNRYFSKVQFDGSAGQVQDIFAFAREQAISRSTTVTVSYDRQNHAFNAVVTPPQPQTDLPAALAGSVNPDGSPLQGGETQRLMRLDPDVSVSEFHISSNPSLNGQSADAGPGGGSQLHFQPDGTVEGATIGLTGATGYSAMYQLWPATGRLTRLDPEP